MGTIRQEKGLPGFHADVLPGDHSQLTNGYETWAIRQSLLCHALFLLDKDRACRGGERDGYCVTIRVKT